MRRFLASGALVLLVSALVATPASAGGRYSKVKGHVIKVEQRVNTANGGEYDRLTIRTRQGEEMQLHLGQGGACDGCFQEGDRIRARVGAADGSGGPREVRSMKVRRGGEMHGYVHANGTMVRERSGPGGGGGGGVRLRSRTHEPGSGSCAGRGTGQRGGGAGRRAGGGGGG